MYSVTGAIGTGSIANLQNPKPTATAKPDLVKGNHTYKFGGETVFDGLLAHLRTMPADH